jgi:hypothetical protein
MYYGYTSKGLDLKLHLVNIDYAELSDEYIQLNWLMTMKCPQPYLEMFKLKKNCKMIGVD